MLGSPLAATQTAAQIPTKNLSKTAQVVVKTAKMVQDGPPNASRTTKMAPREEKIAPRYLQDGARGLQDDLKEGQTS